MSYSKRYRVLVLDDDEAHLKCLKKHLLDAFASDLIQPGGGIPIIETQSDAREVERQILSGPPLSYDVIIADVFMPLHPGDKLALPDVEGGAIRIYRALKKAHREEDVFLVIMTNRNSDAEPELAKIRADHRAYDIPWTISHYPKPTDTPGPTFSERLLQPSDWTAAVKEAILHCRDRDWKKTFVRCTLEEIVGCSSALTEAKIRAARFANEKLILITGETGTGKELIAEAIHRNSARSTRGGLNTFKARNCGHLRGDLGLVELFGCEKGYATLVSAKAGVFEQALNGTVFLDEFGKEMEIAQALDNWLPRFLDNWEFTRMGGAVTKTFQGTLIFGGSQLDSVLRSPKMSDDFRSRVGEASKIEIPSLRKRPEDIVPLAEFFLKRACEKARKVAKELSTAAKDRLRVYSWPGNVRQLQEMMGRLGPEDKFEVDVEDLPEHVRAEVPPETPRVTRIDPSPEEIVAAWNAASGQKAIAARKLYNLPSGLRYEGQGGVQAFVKKLEALKTQLPPEWAAKLCPSDSRPGRRKRKTG